MNATSNIVKQKKLIKILKLGKLMRRDYREYYSTAKCHNIFLSSKLYCNMSALRASSSGQARQTQRASNRHELVTTTIRTNKWAYAHLRVIPEGHSSHLELDLLQAKSFCTTALGEYLGISGRAVPVDILKVTGNEFWVRVPSRDLPRFDAALSAWNGPSIDGRKHAVISVASSEWLGTLISRDGQSKLWS